MKTLDSISAPISVSDSLNAIIARYPHALPVLQRFGFDTCCGGTLALSEAVVRHDLDLDQVVTALRVAAQERSQ